VNYLLSTSSFCLGLVAVSAILFGGLFDGHLAQANQDPLRDIKERLLRADAMIVLDRSGSMNLTDFSDPDVQANWTVESTYDFATGAGNKYKSGPDCLGIRTGDVDICGDGICTGKEHFWKSYPSYNGFYKCDIDCMGDIRGYKFWYNTQCSYQHYPSFMARNKQMFRNILPEVREYVRLSVVSHHQDGYYTYYRGDPARPTSKQGTMFTKWELKLYGGWNDASNGPKGFFTWAEAQQDYYINSDPTNGSGIAQDSLYARQDDTLIEKRFPFGGDVVEADGYRWLYRGTYYNFHHLRAMVKEVKHYHQYVHGTVQLWALNSLSSSEYNSTTGPVNAIQRQVWMMDEKVWVTQYLTGSPFPGGVSTNWDASPKNIHYQSTTQSETRCVTTWKGEYLAGDDVDGCVSGHQFQAVAAQYQYLNTTSSDILYQEIVDRSLGQQYTKPDGTTWYLRPFQADIDSNTPHYERYGGGFVTECNGEAPVLVPLDPSDDQVDQDRALGKVMALANTAANGGMVSSGETPLGPAMAKALEHYRDRANGTGPFAATGPDPYAACRPRFVVMITDSSWACDNSTAVKIASHAAALRTGEFASNPIKTFVLLTPGAYWDIAGANQIAAAGGTSAAIQVNNTTEFVDQFKDVILDHIRGSFTTTSPISATSPGSNTRNNLSLVTTTDVPEFEGNMAVYDHRQSETDPNYKVWDAKAQIATRDWKDRKLYIGGANINSGIPSNLIAADGSGQLNINGCPTCGASTVSSIWTSLYSEAPPADLAGFVASLVSADKTPSFGPFINSAPVQIGGPPRMDALPNHASYEQSHASRSALIYAMSDSGFIHAIEPTNGNEAFAFFPAVYLKDAYNAYLGSKERSLFDHNYIQANSPRVYDSPVGTTGWATKLIATQGPGGSNFVELDITNPDATPPVKVSSDATSTGWAYPHFMGESWSVPGISYYVDDNSGLQSALIMGSGYRSDKKGYMVSMKPIGHAAKVSGLTGISATVDYGLPANTAVIVDTSDKMAAVASYQSDLSGRIVRYSGGGADDPNTVIINNGTANPFYFPPAVVLREDNSEIIAAASGSYYEIASWMTGTAPGFESRIFLQSYNAISTSLSENCLVSEICGGCSFSKDPGFTCEAPGSNALPVSQPMIIYNNVTDETDVFYLFYEPTVAQCGGGASTFISLRIAKNGAISVKNTKRYEGEFLSGMSVVGDGSDIAFARSVVDSGSSAGKPSVFTIRGEKIADTPSAIMGGPGAGSNSVVERWHEVR